MSSPGGARRARRWPHLILGGLAASAAALLLMPSAPPCPDPGIYQTRGVETSNRSLDGDHALRVLRVRNGDDGRPAVSEVRSLRPGDDLRFVVFSRENAARVSLLQVDEAGRRVVLIGRHEIEPEARMRRLDLAPRVSTGALGRCRFVAVFEHWGKRDLMQLPLAARDEAGLSVRVVSTEMEE